MNEEFIAKDDTEETWFCFSKSFESLLASGLVRRASLSY